MSNSIRLSPKHGVNPSILVCPICGKDTGLALNGLINLKHERDVQAEKHMRDQKPCEKCEQDLENYKSQGFLVLIAHDSFSPENRLSPWLYFVRLAVLKREAIVPFLERQGIDTSHSVIWMTEQQACLIGLTA